MMHYSCITDVLHVLQHCSTCSFWQPNRHHCIACTCNFPKCSCMAGAAKQGKKEAAEESESDGGSDSGSGAEPSASASGSEFAVDGAGEHEEEGEGAAQARRQEGEEEEAAQEASGSEDGSGEAAPGSKTALQPSRSPASEKAGPRKRVLVLSDDED